MTLGNTNAEYPVRPWRPNYTDIRTMQIFDPIVADSNNTIHSAWELLHAPSITAGTAGQMLENGIRIKNTYGANDIIYISTTSAGTAGTGFALGQDEELFLEVRLLCDVWVKAPTASNDATATYIAS
jgi:hypothetical protein